MKAMIAYSAIDEGADNTSARPYGDTGIRALFDDANDLGLALSGTNVSSTLEHAASAIGAIMVQYAGQLAVRKVLQSDQLGTEALSGVLTLSQDETTLTVSFADELWEIGGTAPPDTIVGRVDLVTEAFALAGGDLAQITDAMEWLWGSSGIEVIDAATFAVQDGALTTTLPDLNPSDFDHAKIFVAGGQGDDITGSIDNNFIHGGAGNDTLRGGQGNRSAVWWHRRGSAVWRRRR